MSQSHVEGPVQAPAWAKSPHRYFGRQQQPQALCTAPRGRIGWGLAVRSLNKYLLSICNDWIGFPIDEGQGL